MSKRIPGGTMNCLACGNQILGQPSVGRFHRTCVERLLTASEIRSASR